MVLAKQLLAAFSLGAFAVLPAQLSAQPDEVDDPGYRTYSSTTVAIADPDKPADQLEREAALFRARAEGCDSGNVEACADLGESYEFGIGSEQNRPIAEILYRSACDADNAAGCFRLARLTAGATDSDVAVLEAKELFAKACRLGSLDGCAEQARAYMVGWGQERDRETGLALLRETCERGGARACLILADDLGAYERDAASKGEAIAIRDRLCRAGNGEACMDLDYLGPLEEMHPLQPPRVETLTFACNAGEAVGCKQLADAAFVGAGMPQDIDYALQLYARACELHEMKCSAWTDMRDAPELTRLCNALDVAACARLGQIRLRNDLPLQDRQGARFALDFACRAGDADSCYNAAIEWFTQYEYLDAAQLGHVRVLLEIGCAGGAMASCDQLHRSLEEGGRFVADRVRANALLAVMCENEYGDACREVDLRLAEGEPISLPAASQNYLPPIDPDAENPLFAYLTEEERRLMDTACVRSKLTFRGREYSDIVCRSDGYVVGGKRLRPGQAPWQALIWRPERMQGRTLTAAQRVACGGSLIADGWVLTAAHCFLNKDGTEIAPGHTIRLGVYNPRGNEGITYPIVEVIRHKSFRFGSYAYDVALVRYDTRAGRAGAATNSIRRIAIDAQSLDQRRINGGESAYIYGWGLTAPENSSSTAALLGAKLRLESEATCTAITGLRVAQICAKGANNEQACGGDSGGPLVSYRAGVPTVIGIVSAGWDCGIDGRPSLYTRIGAVRLWIDRELRDRGVRLQD